MGSFLEELWGRCAKQAPSLDRSWRCWVPWVGWLENPEFLVPRSFEELGEIIALNGGFSRFDSHIASYRIISPYRHSVKSIKIRIATAWFQAVIFRNLNLLRSPPKVREDGIMTYEWKSVVERDRCAVPAAPEQPACSSSGLMSSSWCSHFGFKMNSTYSEPRVCCSHFSSWLLAWAVVRGHLPGVGRSQQNSPLIASAIPWVRHVKAILWASMGHRYP